MVEWFVGLAVRQAGDDAVITAVASCISVARCFGVAGSITKGAQDFLLSADRSVKSLPSHPWSSPEGNESPAGEQRVIGWGQCVIFNLSHIRFFLLLAKTSHAYSGARAMVLRR